MPALASKLSTLLLLAACTLYSNALPLDPSSSTVASETASATASGTPPPAAPEASKVPQDGKLKHAPYHGPTIVNDASGGVQVSFANYLGENDLIGYVYATDSNNNLFFVQSDGQLYYPGTGGSVDPNQAGIPLGGQSSTTSVELPNPAISGRIYVANGQLTFTNTNGFLYPPNPAFPGDANNAISYQFVEFNFPPGEPLYADLSYINLMGIPLGMTLSSASGAPEQSVLGPSSSAPQNLCSQLQQQTSSDGYPWGDGCIYTDSSNSDLLRVISPSSILATNGGAFDGYFDNYANQVYSQLSNGGMSIYSGGNLISCDVNGNSFDCNGNNYPQPSAANVFACSGAVNTDPISFIMCAAWNRGTWLEGSDSDYTGTDGQPASGAIQPSLPPSYYYPDGGVYNYWAKYVHQNLWESEGYAFPRDDRTPPNSDPNDPWHGAASGLIVANNPDTLTVTIGGYDLAATS